MGLMGIKRTAATFISDSDDEALFTEILTSSYETGDNVNREHGEDHTPDDDYSNLTVNSFSETDHSSDEDYDCKGNTHHSESNKEKGKVTDMKKEKQMETKWKQRHIENVSAGGGLVLCCHWCRQQSESPHVRCSRCVIKFCPRCLKNRNGENIEEEMQVRWVCPRCRGGCGRGCKNCCNCGPCRKTQGLPPTGQLARTAREAGFSSVHDYLISLKTKESAKVIERRKDGRGWTYATGALFAYSAILPIPSWGKKGKRKSKKHRRSFPSSPCEESEQDVRHGKKCIQDYKKRILAFPSSSYQCNVTSIDTAGPSKRPIASRVESEEQEYCTTHDRAVGSGSEETQRYQTMVISLDAMNLSSKNGDRTGSSGSVLLEYRKTGLLPKHSVVPKRKRSARKSTSRRREHYLSLDKSASAREELNPGVEQNTSRPEEPDFKVDQKESIREELDLQADQFTSERQELDPKVDGSKSRREELVCEVVQSESGREELVCEVVQSESVREVLNHQVDKSKSRREELDLQVDQCALRREELDPKVHQSTSIREELVSVVQSESTREELDPKINQSIPRRHKIDPTVCEVTLTGDPNVDREKREVVQMSSSCAERRQLELLDLNTFGPCSDDHSDTSSQEVDVTDVPLCSGSERQVTASAESAGTNQISDSFKRRFDHLLGRPFSTEQLKRMWSHFNLHFVDISDFTEKIAKTYTPGGKLSLLRGFFFWLQHSSVEGAFQPWASENTEDGQTDDYAPLSISDSQVPYIEVDVDTRDLIHLCLEPGVLTTAAVMHAWQFLRKTSLTCCWRLVPTYEAIGEKISTFHFPSLALKHRAGKDVQTGQ